LDDGLFPAKPNGDRGEPQFDRDFWSKCRKKKDRKRALAHWNTMKTTERWKACDYQPVYYEREDVKDCPVKFIKSGFTYLQDEPWNDGYEDQPKPKPSAPDRARNLSPEEQSKDTVMERLRREHAAKKAAQEGRAAA
jgi:hypothetical protein